jgi:hypothetical protein
MSNETTNPLVRVSDKVAEQLRREAYRQRKSRRELIDEAWQEYMRRLKRERGRVGERA